MAPRTPLVDPDAYFAREDGYSLVSALVVVTAFWAGIVAYVSVLAWYLFEYAAELPDASFAGLVPAIAIVMGVSLLLLWALKATILHGVTQVAGGTGSVRETIAIAAWGFAPLLGAVVIQLVTTPFTVPDEPIEAEDPAVVVEQFAAGTPLVVELVSVVALVGAMVWAVYVWTHGLARAHDVSVRRAAIAPIITAVFVPVVLGVF